MANCVYEKLFDVYTFWGNGGFESVHENAHETLTFWMAPLINDCKCYVMGCFIFHILREYLDQNCCAKSRHVKNMIKNDYNMALLETS